METLEEKTWYWVNAMPELDIFTPVFVNDESSIYFDGEFYTRKELDSFNFHKAVMPDWRS